MRLRTPRRIHAKSAGRATSAAPSYFPSIKIPDERGQPCSYVDGALGYNNPSKELLNEARDVYGPDHSVGCFISIGTGRDKNASLSNARKVTSAYQAFRSIALSSEQAHWNLEQYFAGTPDVYFRFNAGARLIDAKGDEDFVKAVNMEDWRKMTDIETLTEEYLAEGETQINANKCAQKLSSISRT
ncbi:FabD/lysophospholipase-like protein [Ceratobasidium sp. AG-I]|nr:FabD/lysophospholipase-like protein [Ceratobasidium sp. AG-I]